VCGGAGGVGGVGGRNDVAGTTGLGVAGACGAILIWGAGAGPTGLAAFTGSGGRGVSMGLGADELGVNGRAASRRIWDLDGTGGGTNSR
jgi:hypothetical protein